MHIEKSGPATQIEILIVEDSPTQAELLRHLLEENGGYHVHVVNRAKSAIELLHSTLIQFILSDVVMPEMDGYTLCQVIKGDPRLASIPVFLVTTLTDPHDVIRGIECGADGFIRKPYDDVYLLTRIRQTLLDRSSRGQTTSSLNGSLHANGRTYAVPPNPQQILDLLISTYEQAVAVSKSLVVKERQVSELNAHLARHAAALEANNTTLLQNKIELEAANRTKTRFLANMSHELRTPLNAIIGFSQLLKDGVAGELVPKQKNMVEQVFLGGEHLLALINDILDLSKVEAGKMVLEPEWTMIEPALQRCASFVTPRATERQVSLVVEVDSQLTDAWVDGRKFKQIFLNLLTNAVKFTRQGSQVTVRARRLVGQDGEVLHVDVLDQGQGIAAADLGRLFKPFEQLENARGGKIEGTGLGLALVKQFCELHGGQVTVRSTLGEGSCFSVDLPLRSSKAAVPQPLT